MSTKPKVCRKLKYNLTNKSTKSKMVSLIQPSMNNNCLNYLKFTNTEKEKLSRFDRRAENIIGDNFILMQKKWYINTQ